jgi:alkylhydroperoxidase family enzyme
MTHLAPIDYDSSPPPLRVLLAAAAPHVERPLALHLALARSPAALAAYVGLREALDEHGTFDLKTRAAIMLTVATSDRSAYSQAVNSMLAQRGGWEAAEIDAIRSGTALGDPRIDALLAVTRETADQRGHVSDATWQAALAAGWTEAQLAEAFTSIGLALYADYFLHYAGVALDVPAAQPA